MTTNQSSTSQVRGQTDNIRWQYRAMHMCKNEQSLENAGLKMKDQIHEVEMQDQKIGLQTSCLAKSRQK